MRRFQEILESDVRLGVKRAAGDTPDDTGSRDPQDDDDTSERMALASAVQEELDFMRQLKVYPEVPADLVLKAGEPEEFEAYRLLLRRYEPQTTATTVTKLVELLSSPSTTARFRRSLTRRISQTAPLHLVWTRQRAEQWFLETIMQPEGIVCIGIQELECPAPQLESLWSGTNGSMSVGGKASDRRTGYDRVTTGDGATATDGCETTLRQ